MALNMFEIAIKLVLVSLLNDLLKKFEALQGTFDVLLSTRCKHLVWKSEIAFDQNTHDFNLVLYVRLLNHLFNFLAWDSSYYFFSSYILLFEKLLNLVWSWRAILLPILALQYPPSSFYHLIVPRFYPLFDRHILIKPRKFIGPNLVFRKLFKSLSYAWWYYNITIYALVLILINLNRSRVLVFEVLIIFVLKTIFLLVYNLNILQQIKYSMHIFDQNIISCDDHFLLLLFGITLLILRFFSGCL